MSKASRRRKKNERRRADHLLSNMTSKSKQLEKQQQAAVVAAVRQEVRQEVRHFSGPLPPPDLLKQYDEVAPGAAERIIGVLEMQTRHRIAMESQALTQENARSWGGLMAGLLVSLACIGCGTACVLNGYETAGATIATASVIGLATVFVIGNRMRSHERAEKALIMTGKK